MIAYDDDGTTRKPGDFHRNQAGKPKVSPPQGRKRVGLKRDLIAAAIEAGINLPEKVTVAQLHDLLGREPGSRVAVERCSYWPFDDWSGIDIIHADRGTWAHSLTSWIDSRGGVFDDAELLPVDLIAEAERLEIPPDVQYHCARDWVAFRGRTGLRSIVDEATVVNDDLDVAGTLDGVDEVTSPIVTPWKTLPAGSLVVVDKKTSDEVRRAGYAAQLARYAGSKPYDTETDLRGEWPSPIDQDVAFIAQYRLAAKLSGDDICWELIPFQLSAGFHLAQSVYDLARVDVTEHFATIAAPSGLPNAEVEQRAGEDPPASPATTDTGGAVDRETTAPPVSSSMPPPRPPAPDEGGDAHEPSVVVLEGKYKALTAAQRQWVNQVAAGATKKGYGFSLSPSNGRRTLRRYEIMRGLVILADGDSADDDALRGVVALTMGAELAHSMAWPVGAVVGAQGVEEAARFALACSAFVDGEMAAVWDGRRLKLSPSEAA